MTSGCFAGLAHWCLQQAHPRWASRPSWRARQTALMARGRHGYLACQTDLPRWTHSLQRAHTTCTQPASLMNAAQGHHGCLACRAGLLRWTMCAQAVRLPLCVSVCRNAPGRVLMLLCGRCLDPLCKISWGEPFSCARLNRLNHKYQQNLYAAHWDIDSHCSFTAGTDARLCVCVNNMMVAWP